MLALDLRIEMVARRGEPLAAADAAEVHRMLAESEARAERLRAALARAACALDTLNADLAGLTLGFAARECEADEVVQRVIADAGLYAARQYRLADEADE